MEMGRRTGESAIETSIVCLQSIFLISVSSTVELSILRIHLRSNLFFYLSTLNFRLENLFSATFSVTFLLIQKSSLTIEIQMENTRENISPGNELLVQISLIPVPHTRTISYACWLPCHNKLHINHINILL
jgi:hypothetical protein